MSQYLDRLLVFYWQIIDKIEEKNWKEIKVFDVFLAFWQYCFYTTPGSDYFDGGYNCVMRVEIAVWQWLYFAITFKFDSFWILWTIKWILFTESFYRMIKLNHRIFLKHWISLGVRNVVLWARFWAAQDSMRAKIPRKGRRLLTLLLTYWLTYEPIHLFISLTGRWSLSDTNHTPKWPWKLFEKSSKSALKSTRKLPIESTSHIGSVRSISVRYHSW